MDRLVSEKEAVHRLLIAAVDGIESAINLDETLEAGAVQLAKMRIADLPEDLFLTTDSGGHKGKAKTLSDRMRDENNESGDLNHEATILLLDMVEASFEPVNTIPHIVETLLLIVSELRMTNDSMAYVEISAAIAGVIHDGLREYAPRSKKPYESLITALQFVESIATQESLNQAAIDLIGQVRSHVESNGDRVLPYDRAAWIDPLLQPIKESIYKVQSDQILSNPQKTGSGAIDKLADCSLQLVKIAEIAAGFRLHITIDEIEKLIRIITSNDVMKGGYRNQFESLTRSLMK